MYCCAHRWQLPATILVDSVRCLSIVIVDRNRLCKLSIDDHLWHLDFADGLSKTAARTLWWGNESTRLPTAINWEACQSMPFTDNTLVHCTIFHRHWSVHCLLSKVHRATVVRPLYVKDPRALGPINCCMYIIYNMYASYRIYIIKWHIYTYLVRAGSSIKPQISSATKTACNNNSNVTYLVSCWPPWTVEEGDLASFFCWRPRTGASSENVPRAITGLSKRSIIVRQLT